MDYKILDNNSDCQSVDSGYDEDTIWEPIIECQTTLTLSSQFKDILWENTQHEELAFNRPYQLEAVVDKSNYHLLFDVNSGYSHFHDDDVLQKFVKAKINCHQKKLAYVPPPTLINVATLSYNVAPLSIVSKLWNLFELSLSTYEISKRLQAIAEVHTYFKTIAALGKSERNIHTDVQPMDVFEKGVSYLASLQLNERTCVHKELEFINSYAKNFKSLFDICEEYIKTRNNRWVTKESACYQQFPKYAENLDQTDNAEVLDSIAQKLNDCVTLNMAIDETGVIFSDIDTILWDVLDEYISSEDDRDSLSYVLIEYFYAVTVMVFLESKSSPKSMFLEYVPTLMQGFQEIIFQLTQTYHGRELLALKSGYETGLRLFFQSSHYKIKSVVGFSKLGICCSRDVICLLGIMLAVSFKGYKLGSYNRDEAIYAYLSEYFDICVNSFRGICRAWMDVPVSIARRHLYEGLQCQARPQYRACLYVV